MPTARVNGVRLFYEATGSGHPVLFIHGGYGGASTALVPNLPREITGALPPDRFRVIAYDRRNAGQSEFSQAHFTLEDLADDARALLDHLGVARAVIVGSSAGGPIALQFALTYPGRTLALCLANTSANLMSPERPRGRAFIDLVAKARSEGDRAAFEARKAALRQPPPLIGMSANDEAAIRRDEALRRALTAVSDEELFRLSTGEVRNVEAYQGVDLTPRLAELKMPVCVIHGTADATVPYSWGEALHKGIPGSEFHPVQGADHGILLYEEARQHLKRWAGQIVSARNA